MAAKAPFLSIRTLGVSLLLCTTTFVHPSLAIFVAPSSPCSVSCGNVLGSTSYTDLVCKDSEFSGSVTGQTASACLNCEVNSTYVDPTSKVSDLGTLLCRFFSVANGREPVLIPPLDNLRYTASACLWGSPGNIGIGSNQCVTDPACGKLLGAVQYQNLSTTANPLGYCDSWDSSLLQKCEACISALGDRKFLSNFFVALDAGCQQKPATGTKLALSGTLFGQSDLTIATPTGAGNGPQYTFTPDNSSLSLGAKVGIAVGSLVAILIAVGCGIVCFFKRKRRTHLKKLEMQYTHHEPPSMTNFRNGSIVAESPQDTISSQRRIVPMAPLQTQMTWQKNGVSHYNESPISTMGEQPSFSPYISPVTPQAVVGREWNLPITLSSSNDIKGKSAAVSERPSLAEAIEMQRLAAAVPMAPKPKGEQTYDVVPIPAPYASPPPTKTTFGHL